MKTRTVTGETGSRRTQRCQEIKGSGPEKLASVGPVQAENSPPGGMAPHTSKRDKKEMGVRGLF